MRKTYPRGSLGPGTHSASSSSFVARGTFVPYSSLVTGKIGSDFPGDVDRRSGLGLWPWGRERL